MAAFRRCATVVVAVAGLCLSVAGAAGAHGRWRPPPHLTWYWQLQGRVRLEHVAATDIDAFDNSAAEVARLHRLGQHVICYVDVGSWERWRPDAGTFPRAVLGKSNGWPGERWLDVRRLSILEPRQLTYDDWVARTVHGLGMAAFEKNDPVQATALEPHFDGVLDEQCNQYHECASFRPYLRAGKPVLNAEYKRSLFPAFCTNDQRLGISGALYALGLNGTLFRECPVSLAL